MNQEPRDINSRTKLLGYYFHKQLEDPSMQKAHQESVLWLIQNAPESEILALPFGLLFAKINAVGYSQGKNAWIDQLKLDPENLQLLENAAKFFMLTDPELAEESLLKAQSLDKNNPKWSAELGQLYSLNIIKKSGNNERAEAKRALDQLEISYNLSSGIEQAALLAQLANAAMAAQETTKAKEYAEIMLSKDGSDWNSGDNIHHGNITLGRIAFAAGDVKTAKEHLLKAGNTSGSPQLNSFGPNMSLAKELLQEGEKDVVLKYLVLCAKFWESGKDRLEKWLITVKEGRIPESWHKPRP
ncbi:tetratricopeptide repeat protein [Gimesia aquarii]|uniref:tetratricopeptide repeat protein n=1 Tax=Gimesia aquarii TaxID=2527964 RepID=UPI0011AA4236|nr:RNA polymerase subunit sigma-24 [Gimesia aquarii]